MKFSFMEDSKPFNLFNQYHAWRQAISNHGIELALPKYSTFNLGGVDFN